MHIFDLERDRLRRQYDVIKALGTKLEVIGEDANGFLKEVKTKKGSGIDITQLDSDLFIKDLGPLPNIR